MIGWLVVSKIFRHPSNYVFDICNLLSLPLKSRFRALLHNFNFVLDVFAQLVNLFSDSNLNLINFLINILNYFGNSFICFNKDNVLFIWIPFLDVQEPNKIFEKCNLLLSSALFEIGLKLCESITHDSNQHVHEYDKTEESSKNKKDPGQIWVFSIAKSIIAEFTQGKHIHG